MVGRPERTRTAILKLFRFEAGRHSRSAAFVTSAPTLADIAKIAKCSTATVSLALRGDSRVAESTRLEVAGIARQLGYVPNPALAALAIRRWGGSPHSQEAVIAVIALGLEPSRRALGGTYHGEPEMITAVKGRAAELGYKVEFYRIQDYPALSTLKRILLARGITGVLLTGAHREQALNEDFLKDFASVIFGMSFAKPLTHAVESDWPEGIRLAFEQLRERNYRRIGVVLRPYSLQEKGEMVLSRTLLEVDTMTRKFGPQPRIELLGPDESEQEAQFLKWYRKEKPDAIVASNNIVYGWVKKLEETRSRPAVMCLYNQGAGSDRQVSCLHHSHAAEGKEAVDLLDHLLRYRLVGVPRYPTLIMVAPTWQEGSSVPRAQSSQTETGRDHTTATPARKRLSRSKASRK